MIPAVFNTIKAQFQRCIICENSGHPKGICHSCRRLLPYRPKSCSRCNTPLGNKTLCDCHALSFNHDHIASVFYYEPPISSWIQDVKYRHDLFKARVLSNLIEPFLRVEGEWVVPIPLHRKKRQKRGFNQNEVFLHRALASKRRFLKKGWLVRVEDSPGQIGQTRAQRHLNSKKAFLAASEVRDQRLLLFDDVFTTGATISAAANQCKTNGAKNVRVLTIAHGSAQE
ncbi:MAG: hypothetical protein CMF48_03200 [Legionellales bacterium]|nr:hypothetical protein [Legionellales bacterium]